MHPRIVAGWTAALCLGLASVAVAADDAQPASNVPAQAAPTALPAPAPATLQATADTWPTWRGDAGQTGRAPGTLDPTGLTSRWTHRATDAFLGAAVVDGSRVYVGNKDGSVVALDRTTGTPVWTFEAGASVEAPPLLVAGLVVFGSRDGHLRALVAETGAPFWDLDLQAEMTGAPVYVPAAAGRAAMVLQGDYDGVLHARDLLTGASRWTYATGSYLYGSPALHDGLAVLGGCDGFVHTVKLADGTGVSKLPVEAYVGASVAWEGDTAFVGHFGNRVLAFDPATAALRWTFFERSFAYLSSPALTDEAVVLGGRDRVLHGIDRKTGESLWWFPARGKVDSSPVVVAGKAVVGSHDGRVYVVDVETGEELRALDVGAAVSASPAVAGGWVYVGAEDGTFHAFGPPEAGKAPSRRKR